MPEKNKTLTYNKGMTRTESYRVIQAIAIPLIIFWLQVFTVNNFAQFGEKIISPATALMWIIGFVVAFFMPSERQEVLKQTMTFCAIYCLSLLGLKLALGLVSGVSSEMIAASYNQAIPTTTGNAIPGYLQNILWFTAIGIPIAFIAMQGKRFFQFSKTRNIQKTYGRVRNIRNSGKEITKGVK